MLECIQHLPAEHHIFCSWKELLDKFLDTASIRLFLSDRSGAPYKDSYLSERLVRCHQVVCRFDACMLLNLKEMVGANGFEPSTSWSRTRNKSC
jgi:hypothetical protein